MKMKMEWPKLADGQLEIAAFECSRGWIAVAWSAQGIVGATLFRTTQEEALAELWGAWPGAQLSEAERLPQLGEWLRRYAEGERINLAELPFDLSHKTPFQQAVLRAILAIPPGQTWTYGEVARAVGKPRAARAVGQVLAHNPIPLFIPCHRVVASDGSLGGFGAPGGLALKQALLDLERGSQATRADDKSLT